jgi:hypothetical protein
MAVQRRTREKAESGFIHSGFYKLCPAFAIPLILLVGRSRRAR